MVWWLSCYFVGWRWFSEIQLFLTGDWVTSWRRVYDSWFIHGMGGWWNMICLRCGFWVRRNHFQIQHFRSSSFHFKFTFNFILLCVVRFYQKELMRDLIWLALSCPSNEQLNVTFDLWIIRRRKQGCAVNVAYINYSL